ncbi:MAG: hypothetical protein C4293_02450 [Nitrospiraceae bacterium]
MQDQMRQDMVQAWLGITEMSRQRRLGVAPLGIIEDPRWIEDSLARELSRAQRSVSPLTLVLCQLDARLSLTDVLRQVFIRACQTSLRRYDYAGRVAKDKFILLLPDCYADAGQGIVHRILAHIYAATVSLPSVRWRINIGIACFPFDGETLADLVQAAYGDLEQGYRSATVASLRGADNRLQEVESHAASLSGFRS